MLRAGVRTIWSLRTRNQQFCPTKSSDSSSTPLLVYWLFLGHENSRIPAKMEGLLVISPKKECLTGFANIERRGRHFETASGATKRDHSRVLLAVHRSCMRSRLEQWRLFWIDVDESSL